MQTQNQAATRIDDPTFNQLLKKANASKRGVPVKGSTTADEGFIVSKSEYEQMERIREDARKQFFDMTDEIRTRVAQSGRTEEEIQATIDTAVDEVQADNAT